MQFEDVFWSGVDLNDLHKEYYENANNAQARVFMTGMKEFNRIDFKYALSSIISASVRIPYYYPPKYFY